MALLACSECGKEISDKASACPNCGAPLSASKETSPISGAVSPPVSPPQSSKKSEKLKYIVLGIVIIAVISAFAGGEDDKNPSEPSQSAASSATNATEQKVDYGVMSASTLFNAFKQNAVAANQKFMNKRVAIEGNIDSIDSSFMGYPQIVFEVDGSYGFANVTCEFPKSAIDAIAKMSTGQHVVIIGTVKGLIINSVTLDNCVFSETSN